MNTRPALAADKAAIIDVLVDTELFPVEMLDDLMQPFLDGAVDEHWFVCDARDQGVIGFGFLRPEELAEGTWNLLAIGVRRKAQGNGAGRAMMRYAETFLSKERILIIETSGTDAFAMTRDFYLKCGYTLEAMIRDYWAPEDDKVIFWKRLRS